MLALTPCFLDEFMLGITALEASRTAICSHLIGMKTPQTSRGYF
jgi:hypothetical protein